MLGDAIEAALASVGVTKDRVERWIGGPCGCVERQQKLNALSRWASRFIAVNIATSDSSGSIVVPIQTIGMEQERNHLNGLMNAEQDDQ